jgi:hypothetical protein
MWKGLYVGLPNGERDMYVNLTQTNIYLFSRFKYIQREKFVIHKDQLLYFIFNSIGWLEYERQKIQVLGAIF